MVILIVIITTWFSGYNRRFRVCTAGRWLWWWRRRNKKKEECATK